ncbi:hypothetical protein AOQ84DRAFT_163344 [Glonium stellatum]|uniref:Uncharacterized protein n=1 Tax=Glonium stellatum TaxID=574774 RepID=A0A8E2JMX5_9PEZI|nr:hypothetical protein AOQ84DRAFT_163344 [Glonium stellatum]
MLPTVLCWGRCLTPLASRRGRGGVFQHPGISASSRRKTSNYSTAYTVVSRRTKYLHTCCQNTKVTICCDGCGENSISWPGRYAIPPQIRHSGSSHHSEVEFADCSCKAVTPAAVPQPDLDILSVDPWSSKEEVQYGLGPQSGPHGVLKNSFPTAF